MNAWSNIEISRQDPEIRAIHELEKRLGKLPDKVHMVRELITRFELCHFKYQVHLKKIRDSISELEPYVNTSNIGINHIKHGEQVLKKDATGKSLTGQQYVWALKNWLKDSQYNEDSEQYDRHLGQQIQNWLGEKNPDKIRLVRLLLARLTWDWVTFEKLQPGGKQKDIVLQVSRMDICHYAFPKNLDVLLKGIGQMKAVEDNFFEGCGTYNAGIKAYLEKEFTDVNETINFLKINKGSHKNNQIKTWLFACLAKTIKEQIDLEQPIADF